MPKASVTEAINRLIHVGHSKVINAGSGHPTLSEYRLVLASNQPTKVEPLGEDEGPTKRSMRRPDVDPWEKLLTRPEPQPLPTSLVATLIEAAPSIARDRSVPSLQLMIDPGHAQNTVGASLTALRIEPAPGDLFWFRQEHKADAADLARLVGGQNALIAALQRAPAAKVPKGFRRLMALTALVREGRG